MARIEIDDIFSKEKRAAKFVARFLRMKQEEIDKNGFVQGTIHRYLIVATK
ncbi:hypothetical protein I6E50_05420 [Roseburia hominis]|uniref:hypothetical protein n=1 Tax=Roseburia hominis TaxID=301301 RepID=UPI001F3C4597|nr:hypothetical protein [Roseburia hominis]